MVIRKKKIKLEKINEGIINCYFSFNNTIVSLSRIDGRVLFQCSGGSIGYKNTKKSTSYVAEKVIEETLRKISDYGMKNIILNLKGVGSGRDIVTRKVIESNENQKLKILELVDKTPIPFNGTRPSKRPRK